MRFHCRLRDGGRSGAYTELHSYGSRYNGPNIRKAIATEFEFPESGEGAFDFMKKASRVTFHSNYIPFDFDNPLPFPAIEVRLDSNIPAEFTGAILIEEQNPHRPICFFAWRAAANHKGGRPQLRDASEEEYNLNYFWSSDPQDPFFFDPANDSHFSGQKISRRHQELLDEFDRDIRSIYS